MRFNNGLERKRLEERWEKLRIEYTKAGMDEESIQLMYEFDFEVYKKERTFCNHNQYFPDTIIEGDNLSEEQSSILDKFMDKLSVCIPENTDESRYGWLEEVENKELYFFLKGLPEESLEILTMIMEGTPKKEIAMKIGISAPSLSGRINVLRKRIKEHL